MSNNNVKKHIQEAFFDAPGPDIGIVNRVAKLQGFIRENAEKGDEDRRVPEAVITALHEEKLFHISIPKHLGGLGGNFRTFIDTVSEVGRADGGTGWAVALLNVCTWFTTLFSEQAQADVFGETPDARVCGVFTTPVKTEKVEGGYRATGEWWYGSGSLHAQWGTLAITTGVLPDGSPDIALALIPMSDLTIRDTWFVAGMRASGSNTIVADNVFIPEHRVHSFGAMANEDYLREFDEEPNYHASFIPVAEIVLVAAQIGLARAALDITLEKGASKPVAYTIFTEARQSPVHQIKVAEAASQIDAAYFLITRACADVDRAALSRTKLDPLTRARIRMDTGQCAQLCREAINKLLSVNGAGSFASANPLQRIWRDSEVASRHSFVHPEMASHIYGRVLLGVEDIVQPF